MFQRVPCGKRYRRQVRHVEDHDEALGRPAPHALHQPVEVGVVSARLPLDIPFDVRARRPLFDRVANGVCVVGSAGDRDERRLWAQPRASIQLVSQCMS